ncbi:serine/threonine protein kinase, putative [Acanthamoeba castellanii str. Neff]|uniref:Serine/threonine protein kinase, putative n=1 Tax=Acanthamoeba castellanii (strain ATCC 30010 / Neff) TaxID=1257118 RepID=L8GDJ8_ACACF|nr:serine/threonine protein kinase, putative [Acanthamoeba castellanii str. Neff]ELR11092.1 serine/threonine protein kinase, putative [Acanthamoeba castellanii str. Neff]
MLPQFNDMSISINDDKNLLIVCVVYCGKWKGVEVAVKQFIKQKLNEQRMLKFRAEMAFLLELHHPNIVLFIGGVKKCWHASANKRPKMEDVLAFLDKQVGNDTDGLVATTSPV